MRACYAIVRYVVSSHLRRPLLFAVAIFYGLIAVNVPSIGESGSVLGFRMAGSLGLGVGHLVLVVLALVLPLSTAGQLGVKHLGVTRPPAAVQLSAALGHVLILILAAFLSAGICMSLVGALQGWPDRRGAEVSLRRQLWEGPDSEVVLGPDRESAVLGFHLGDRVEFARAEARGTHADLRVRLDPSFRVVLGEKGASTLRVPLRVGLRVGDGRFESRDLVVRRGTPVLVHFFLPKGFRGGDLEIGLRRLQPGYAVAVKPGSLRVLGGAASYIASLLRGFLLLAAGCVGVVSATLWLARFTAYPIAMAGGLTLALLSSGGIRGLPGAPLCDPGRLMAEGIGLDWGDLGSTAAFALLWFFVAAIPAGRGRREGLG